MSRPETLKSANKNETGGLSGKPLAELSTHAVGDMYRLTGGESDGANLSRMSLVVVFCRKDWSIFPSAPF